MPQNAVNHYEQTEKHLQTRITFFSAVLLLGLFIQFHPTFLSGFQSVQTDEGDTRFNHYVLEHEYRWFRARAGHRSLWNPPFFYPEHNVLAYSDTLLSVAPFYWLFRLIGFGEFSSFQLWAMAMACANFAAAYLLFSRGLKIPPTAALAGAFLFAFSAPRTNQLSHHQLQAHFYTPLFAYCAVKLLDHGSRRRGWYATAAPVLLALQFYASYYLGWFLAAACLTGLLVGTLIPALRRSTFETAVHLWKPLLFGVLLSAALIAPLASHYLSVAETIGYRRLARVAVASPPAWIYLGPDSWLYSWQQDSNLFEHLHMEHEMRLGFGLLTSILVLIGFWRKRKSRPFQLVILTSMVGAVAVSSQVAWMWVYYLLPGAAALRVASRVILLLLLPAGFGLAGFLEPYVGRKWKAGATHPAYWIVLLGLGVVLEQGVTTSRFDLGKSRTRVGAISARIDPDCPTFVVLPEQNRGHQDAELTPVWMVQLDAMWASLSTGVPTLNGHSAHRPKSWELYGSDLDPDEGLELWVSRWPRLSEQICQIPYSVQGTGTH